MKILMCGDIVGSPGRKAVGHILPRLKAEGKVDFAVGNGENAAGGSGITAKAAMELFDMGLDVITSGDHIWDQRDVVEYLGYERRLLRPLNYPEGAPGSGEVVVDGPGGTRVGVLNAGGRVFMHVHFDDPFRTVEAAVRRLREQTPIILVDFHAEATSEKVALGWHLDGLITALVGSHTHVQTADERILPGGTGYITDLGMTGPHDSVLGRRVDSVLSKFRTQMPNRFPVAEGNVKLCGVIMDVDEATGKVRSIERIQEALDGGAST
ncbi:MAG: TIGR00282 family metallophosphoesterase [Candidatus Omnitrophica bacterium]|nr:TIGR00282 family metallophosphoesterase [Candidatus Omnitrophota bacterium]